MTSDVKDLMPPKNLSMVNKTDEYTLNVLAITITITVLMVFAVFGNLLVLLAFYVQPLLRQIIYYPIISLAIADLLCAITAMPLYILKKNNLKEMNERVVCDLYRFSYFFTEYASILSLMVISIERFFVIRSPLNRGIISARVMTTGLIVCWLEAAVVAAMPFYWQNNTSENCTNSPTKAWSFMVISVNVFLPFLVMFFSHCYIYHKTLHEFSNTTKKLKYCRTNSVIRKQNWKFERKATISFSVVIGVFIVCWGPSTIYYFLRNVCPQCFSASFKRHKDSVSATVKILTLSNSFMNSIIYFWLNMDFRKAFLRVLRREWTKKNKMLMRSRSSTVIEQNVLTNNLITTV